MTILILNWRDIKHPLAGGAEISTHEHAKRWAKEGNEVTIFSSSVPSKIREETIDGIKIIRRGNHYTVHIHAFVYYLKNLRNKMDLIIDEFHFIPFFTPLYAKTRRIAFIHETAKDLWFKNQPFPINILGFLLEPLFFKLYREIPFITVSKSTKKDLIKFGINEKNIYIINNGLYSQSSDSKKEKTPTIIYLGRLAKDKGIEDAIAAFHLIVKKFKSINFWVVGREEKKGYKKYLKKRIKKFGLEEKVIFFNFVEEQKKFDLLKRAWILIHPSFKEGWGLTVIEAASCNTPTVAYNVSGLCDSIIDNKTGFLVSIRKPEKLADKIIQVLNDKVLFKNLSRNAELWSKKFDWKDSTDKSLKIIQKTI